MEGSVEELRPEELPTPEENGNNREPVQDMREEEAQEAGPEGGKEQAREEEAEEERISKQWLFQENIRLQAEKKELDGLYLKFLDEKKQFQEEMKLLNQRVLAERKRLKEDTMFFDKKMEILKNGFAQLDIDRKRFEREKLRFETERDMERESVSQSLNSDLTQLFFKGVRNQLTLKKRYKDLIKIFHPDNVCGDTDTIQVINREYERLREEFSRYREA